MHISYRTVEAHEALHKLYGSNYRVTEEVEIIQENLSKLRENRSRKISYIRNLRQHPEIYQPFFIIVTLRLRPFVFFPAHNSMTKISSFWKYFDQWKHSSFALLTRMTLVVKYQKYTKLRLFLPLVFCLR